MLFAVVITAAEFKFVPAQLLVAIGSIGIGGYFISGRMDFEIRARRSKGTKSLGIIIGLILIIGGIFFIFDMLK